MARPTAVGNSALAALGLFAGSAFSRAADDAPFSLFVGVEFRIQHENQFYPVTGVRGEALVITVDGGEVLFPLKRSGIPIQIAQMTRITASSATIANVTHERVYSASNDPYRRWFATQAALVNQVQDNLDRANRVLVDRQDAAAQRDAAIQRGGPAGAAAAASPEPDVPGALRDFSNAAFLSGGDLNNAGFYAGRIQSDRAEENFDAIEASFEINPASPLRDAYFVLFVRFRERDSKPGVSRNWIHAKRLGALPPEPTRVRVWEAGFPLGFEIEKLQVHLYDEGREVATNLSDKRTALGVDDAFQYMLLDYLATNRGATLPATLAVGGGPLKRAVRFADAPLAEPVFVRVSPEGRPLAAFIDDAATRPLENPEVMTVVETLRFRPALDNGEPVEGLVRLRLSEFLQ